MFTGIIEEIGSIGSIKNRGEFIRFEINAGEILTDLAVDDSVAVNGVCLTAVAVTTTGFDVEAVQETLRKTNLGSMKVGNKVNLERALTFSKRLGGHIVQGHVDCTGSVSKLQRQGEGGLLFSVKVPKEKLKYIISEGSIAINGVSLTVARLTGNELTISLIPHTLENTTLSACKVGDGVNIEVDLIGKYVESILSKSPSNTLTEDWIKQQGFN